MSNFLKSSLVRDSVLSALARMLTLAPTVWRDAGGPDWARTGGSVTVRVPAFTVASTRTLRSSGSRTRSGLFESPTVVSLEKEVYRDVLVTSEEQTLDIVDYSRQVLGPAIGSVARGIEDILLDDAILDADYENIVNINESDPFASVVQARKHLNDSRVPFAERTLAVGSSVEALLVSSPQFARADQSGTTATLREGYIGRVAGFDVVTSPGLPPEEAYAYHRSAYALAIQAPAVPTGVTGFTVASDGLAMSLLQFLNPDLIENVVSARAFVGASPVLDAGTVDEDGVFTPAVEPLENGSDRLFVRGVKLSPDGS